MENNPNSSDLNIDDTNLGFNIGTEIQKIMQHASTIKRMCNQLGTNQDTPQFRKQLHQIQQNTEALGKQTSNKLNRLNAIAISRPKSRGALPPEIRQQNLQKERLNNSFALALN